MMRNLVNGAIGGGLATAVYSAMMVTAHRAGLLGEQPSGGRRRSMRSSRARTRASGESMLETIAQFAFGTASGAVLGLLSTGQRIPVPLGAAYGLAVWYIGRQGLVPAVGPAVAENRPGHQALEIAGHLVWGTSLVMALNRLRAERPGAIVAPGPAGERARPATPVVPAAP